VVRIHSPRPFHPIQIKTFRVTRPICIARAFFTTMVETMATPRFVRSFHCGTHRAARG
jgi:hypothetical protein